MRHPGLVDAEQHRRARVSGVERFPVQPAALARNEVDAVEREAQRARIGDNRREALRDRKSGGQGKSISVRVDHGGRRVIKTKKNMIINRRSSFDTSIYTKQIPYQLTIKH